MLLETVKQTCLNVKIVQVATQSRHEIVIRKSSLMTERLFMFRILAWNHVNQSPPSCLWTKPAGGFDFQLLGYVSKTVLATMKLIPGNDRVSLFYGNSLDIHCRVTGAAWFIFSSEVFLPSATGKANARQLNITRFQCRSCWRLQREGTAQKITCNLFSQNEKITANEMLDHYTGVWAECGPRHASREPTLTGWLGQRCHGEPSRSLEYCFHRCDETRWTSATYRNCPETCQHDD